MSGPPPGLLPRLQDFESLWSISTVPLNDGGQGTIYSTDPKPNNAHYQNESNNYALHTFVTKMISLPHTKTNSALSKLLQCYLFVQKHKLLHIYGSYHDQKSNKLLIVMQRLSHELDTPYLIERKTNNSLRFARPGYIYVDNKQSLKRFIKQITVQLHTIHANNGIHFDLKPSNIMWSDTLHKWCIIDYDLMKTVTNENGNVLLTHYRGTQSWTSPEMSTRASIDKPSNINNKTDIFSLGLVILYICDLGFQPYLLQNSDFENVHCKELIKSQKWRRDKVYFDKLLRGGNGNQYLQNYLFQLRADYIIDDSLYVLLKAMLTFDVSLRFSTNQILNYSWLNT